MMELQNTIKFDEHRFWLLLIAGLLIAFNICLLEYNSVYLLFWLAALSITWRKRKDLNFESNIFSTTIGLVLIIWLLFRGVIAGSNTDVILRMYPLFSITAICLVSTKASKIMQYWREILIVSLTAIPGEHIVTFVSIAERISILDAKISRLILWYVGFDVIQKENLVILPTGSIKIAGGCSSLNLLILLLQFCFIICLCFVIKRNQKILLLLCSTVIGLGVNCLRLCLMALLIVYDQQEAFDYWHGSSGAEIFTTIAILLLAVVYWLLIENKTKTLNDI